VKTDIEIQRMEAELAKLRAEHGQITRETFWYPIGVAAGLIAAIGGILTGAVGLGILIGRVWGKL